jgi:hypothetical protein
MLWYHFIAYFFAGAFFTNGIPHFVSGVQGRPFQSPFAKPPGEGLSSSTVNVLWGSFNFVVVYVLTNFVGDFDLRNWGSSVSAALGALVMALFAARTFSKFHGGNQPA